MTQTLRKVDYFYVETQNTAGQGSQIMAALCDAGINLLAFSGFPSGRKAQLDFVPADPAQFKAAAKKMKLKLSLKKTGFLLQGDDKVGALTDILSKLAEANINVTALDAVTSGEGRFGAIFWVKPRDIARTAKLFGVT
ncbi:MAG: ACT domain-containing protein [Alphaproteobacteria bacterium]